MQDTGQGTNKAQQQHDQSQSDNQGRQGTRCLSQPCLLGAVSDGGDLSGTGCCGPLFGVRFGGVGRKTPQRRVGKAALRRIKKRFAFTFKHAGNEILGTVQCNSQAHNIIAAKQCPRQRRRNRALLSYDTGCCALKIFHRQTVLRCTVKADTGHIFRCAVRICRDRCCFLAPKAGSNGLSVGITFFPFPCSGKLPGCKRGRQGHRHGWVLLYNMRCAGLQKQLQNYQQYCRNRPTSFTMHHGSSPGPRPARPAYC